MRPQPRTLCRGSSDRRWCRFRLWLAVALLVPGASLLARDLRLDHLDHLTVEDGLAHPTVWEIHQDRRGFLWFATGNFLQRYDGYRFKAYKHDPDDPGSISANEVLEIYEDRQGGLWFGTRNGGLNRFDQAEERFLRFRHDPADPASLASDTVRAVFEDRAGTLWVGTSEGLHRFHRQQGTFTRYRCDPADPGSLSHNSVWDILEDREGDLWISTSGGGLNRLRGGLPAAVASDRGPITGRSIGAFTRYRHDPADPGSLSHDSVYALYEDRSGTLWAGTSEGLDRFDRASGKFVRHLNDPADPESLGGGLIMAIHEDREGELWIASHGGGLSRLDRADGPLTGRFVQYRHDPHAPHGLSSGALLDLCEDRSGILWIATRGSGIDKFDRRRERFVNYRPGQEGGFAGDQVWAVTADRAGVVWIGTFDGGLSALDRGAPKRPGGSAGTDRPAPAAPPRLADDPVMSILEDRFGELWIGTYNGGLARLSGPELGRFVRYRHDPREPRSLASDHVRCLLEDRSGQLWIGLSDAIQCFDRQQEHFVTYRHDPTDPRSLSSGYIYGLFEDRSGELWIGTTGGLDRFDAAAGSFVHHRHDPRNRNSLSSNEIYVVYEDAEGIFWIGTDAGLNRWDRTGDGGEAGEFRHYREQDGLSSDRVVGILADEGGRLWLSTGHGLSRFDPRTESFRNYDTDDGLHGNAFYIGVTSRRSGGELFFGGHGGLTSFHPDRIADDLRPPPVLLTDFRLLDEPVRARSRDPDSPLSRTITDTRELAIDHRHKVLSFEFAALDYASPRKNRYAYRLEGFDEHWVETDAEQRLARYTNLDPGTYVFRVKASNKDGVWNEEGASLRLVVRPPPWRTWWAYTLYGLALAAVIVGYVRWQRKELRREREEAERERQISAQLREVDKLKDEFLANTSHELRTPLYGITGLAESLIDGDAGELPEAARAHLSLLAHSGRRLTVLVNDILDFSKLRHHSLELERQPVDLHALVDVVLTLSRPLVGAKDLELRNAVPPELPAADADESRLQQILHNLVGNAIKFTESGSVEVAATAQANELTVSVRDTGVGIPEDEQGRIFEAFAQAEGSAEREFGGTGLGLAVTRQLVALHGGTLGVESAPDQGSTFFFTLPTAPEEPAVSPVRRQQPVAPVSRLAEVASAAVEISAEPAVEARDTPEGSARILVVDDEPVNRQVLVNQLAAQGYEITPAASGPEALAAIDRRPADLVLLDVMMPRMSGYEVCRALRERFPLDELPVIFLTAKGQVSDLVVGLAAGANDYLPKPISRSELLARVRTHLALLHVHRKLSQVVAERTAQVAERQRLVEERERLIGELEARNVEMVRFNYTISHDLKNPLVTITNFLGLLRRDAVAGRAESLEHDLESLEAAADQMRQLLEDLFDFSRASVRVHPAEAVPFGELVGEALEELSGAIAERGVVVEVEEDLSTIHGNRAQLRELVRHLLDNAVKHLGDQPAPQVEVGLERDGQDQVFYVRDNGQGIDPQYHDKIFGLFERLDTGSEGTGVGLALVKRVVEIHGGRIWVESDGREQGSTFRFTLPSPGVGSPENAAREERMECP